MGHKSYEKVLLIYEDKNPHDFIINTLSYIGYEVILASSMEEAKELILNSNLHLVLSEKILSDGSGFDVLNFLRKIGPTPFILISDEFDKRDQEGQHLLNFTTINHPFRENDLLDVVNKFMAKQKSQDFVLGGARHDYHEEEFCIIDIDEFISGHEIKYDLFIHIGEKRFVKISHGSEYFTDDQVQSLRLKGVSSLYMRKKDFFEYISMTVSLIKHMPKIKISASRKSLFIQNTNKLLTESILMKHVDTEALSQARTMVESTINMLIGCDEILLTLEFLKNDHKSMFAHSLNVALYSVIMAKKLKVNSSQSLAKLSAAGIFHDLGKSKIPPAILQIPFNELNHSEVEVYQNHVIYGLEMLEDINIAYDVITIIGQHHEDESGDGYPLGINKDVIHPLARILKVADDFCEHMQGFMPSMHNISSTIEGMESHGSLVYDQNCVAALKACFIRTKYKEVA